MGKNLEITEKLERYIEKYSHNLHPIQKEIILYNESLGDIKRMQLAVSQCHFLELIIKVSNINKILEIGTFTGLSTISMALALPEEGNLVALDKNVETNKVAKNFFKKANLDKKIKTIIKPALESLAVLKKNNSTFDMIFIDADKENYQKYYDNSLELVKKNGGRCVFASHPEAGKKISLDPFQLILGKNIKGSWGGKSKPDRDTPILADLYNKGLMPLEALLTKKYTLDEINIALDDLNNSNVFRPLIVIDETLK